MGSLFKDLKLVYEVLAPGPLRLSSKLGSSEQEGAKLVARAKSTWKQFAEETAQRQKLDSPGKVNSGVIQNVKPEDTVSI